MTAQLEHSNFENIQIPDKLYFKIGEVAKLIGVETHVLRYWETEFPDISPKKSQSNQRLYTRQDVELILLIRNLLYKENFTIKGARKRIKEAKSNNDNEDDSQIPLPLDSEQNVKNKFTEEEKKYLFRDLKAIIAEMDDFIKQEI